MKWEPKKGLKDSILNGKVSKELVSVDLEPLYNGVL